MRGKRRTARGQCPHHVIRLRGLLPDVCLSPGGELRERYEFTRNPSFCAGTDLRHDDYLLQRLLLHGDLHLGPNLRVFVQIGDYRAFGRVFDPPGVPEP